MFAPGQQGDKPPKDGHYTPAPRARAPSDEAVIAAFKAGVPVAAIARRAGRTRRSIQCVLRKSGLRPNPHKRPSAAENASGAGLADVESRIAEIEAKYMRAAHGSESWRTYWSGESGAKMQQEYRGLLAAREQTRRGRAG
jgi:hypothetical protein